MSVRQIEQNRIIISTNKSGINLYEMTKSIIHKYSFQIENNIKLIEYGQSLKCKIETIDISCKDEFVEFQTKLINFSRLHSYILNFNIDITMSNRELYLTSNKFEEYYYVKNIYIELFRFLERHNNELGIIRKLNGASEKYKNYYRKLNDFRTAYYEKIKEYRHNLFAHYDNKSQYEDFYKSVNGIVAEEVAIMCLDFLAIQEELSKILENISNGLKNESAIFNDLLLKTKEETAKIIKE